MKLDIGSLEKAITRLAEGMVRYEQNIADEQIRDGLIQRFEFTYELATKTLKRFLEMSSPSPDIFDSMDFQTLIRTANEHGLLRGDWPAWRQYRDMRSQTSHTYNEAKALQVVAGIPAFLAEAGFLRDKLRQRLA